MEIIWLNNIEGLMLGHKRWNRYATKRKSQPLPHESPLAKQLTCNKLLINLECSVFTVLTERLQGQYSKTRDNSRVIGRV